MVDFAVTVIDDRQEFANPGPLSRSGRGYRGRFCERFSSSSFSGNEFVVIVTRGHSHDAEVLHEALSKRCPVHRHDRKQTKGKDDIRPDARNPVFPMKLYQKYMHRSVLRSTPKHPRKSPSVSWASLLRSGLNRGASYGRRQDRKKPIPPQD